MGCRGQGGIIMLAIKTMEQHYNGGMEKDNYDVSAKQKE